MADPGKKKLTGQSSFSHIEQSMKIIPTLQGEPIVIYPGPKSSLANMSKRDLEIAQRLERLRKSSKDIPTEEDVGSKLAKLKGLPPDTYSQDSTFKHFIPDSRTHTEQADSLLAQVMDEVKLDATVPNAEQAIAQRLAQLKDEPAPPLGFSKPITLDQSSVAPGSAPASYGFMGYGNEDVDMKEVEDLMKFSEQEVDAAQKSLASLEKDSSLMQAMGSALKKSKKDKKSKEKKLKKKKAKSSDTSSDELHSCSDSDSDSDHKSKKKKNKKALGLKEKAEVDRIVKMYKKKAKKGELSSDSDSSGSNSEYMSHSSGSDSKKSK